MFIINGIFGKSARQYNRDGNVKFQNGQYQAAIEDYSEAIRLAPDNVNYRNNRGNAKYDLQRYAEAIEDYSEAIRLAPNKARYRSNRGAAKENLRLYEEAIQDYSEAIRLAPHEAYYHQFRAHANYRLQRYAESLDDFNEAIRLAPDNAQFRNNRGVTKFHLQQYDEAIKDFSKAILLEPDNPDYHHSRGFAKENLRLYEEAIEAYGEAIRLTPDSALYNAFYHYRRGDAKCYLQLYEEAIEDYDEAIRLAPDEAVYRNARGEVNYGLQRYAEAIEDFDEAIRLAPNNAVYRDNRGDAKRALQRYEEAIEDYSEAIRLAPDNASYRSNRGNAKYDLQQYEEALKDYDEAIRLEPYVSYYRNSRGNAKRHLQRYAEAIEDYSEAIRLNPDYRQAYLNRANCYEQLGGPENLQLAQNDRARALLIEHRDKPRRNLFIAIQKGQKKQALECLTALRQEQPDGQLKAIDDQGREEAALLTLAKFGHASWLDEFLKEMRINIEDERGNTALHLAAEAGHLEFCQALIDRGLLQGQTGGGYIWTQNRLGQTAFHLAAMGGQARLIISFVKAYQAEGELTRVAVNGDTLVHLLVRNRQTDAIKALFKEYAYLSVRTQNKHGRDALMEAVETQDDLVLSEILRQQVDLANRDGEGRTALHLAVQKNSLTMVQALIQKGASLELRDRHGKTASDYVVKDSRLDVWLTNQQHRSRPREHFSQSGHTYRNLVFQGGSVKGMAYSSAIRTAEEQEIFKLSNIRRVGGTSAGAITAMLVGLGYSCDEIDHIMGIKTLAACTLPQVKFSEFLDGEFGRKLIAAKNQDWGRLLGETHGATLQRLQNIDTGWVALARLLDGTAGRTIDLAFKVKDEITKIAKQFNQEFALCPGKTLRELFETLIRRKLSEKAGIPITSPVTFAELAAYSDFKELYFVGVNLETGEHEVFSNETTPDMVVSDAVRISMSIPGVFYPHNKVRKLSNGTLVKGTALYTDGGVVWNYPVELFDHARYTQEGTRLGDRPEINWETLGFRLVSADKKKRYEGGTDTPEPQNNDPVSLWEHIKSLIEVIALKQQESAHLRQGDVRRTVYVDVLDIGTLDFERVEALATKKVLMQQGREGVMDFVQRRQEEGSVRVELPESLTKKLQEFSKVNSFRMEGSQQSLRQSIDPNCPELVFAFYGYTDVRLQEYLHRSLGIPLWARDKQADTAFHIAVRNKNLAVLKRLLAVDESGIEASNFKGETLLDIAKQNQDQEMVKYLSAYSQERTRAEASKAETQMGLVQTKAETKSGQEAMNLGLLGLGNGAEPMLPQFKMGHMATRQNLTGSGPSLTPQPVSEQVDNKGIRSENKRRAEMIHQGDLEQICSLLENLANKTENPEQILDQLEILSAVSGLNIHAKGRKGNSPRELAEAIQDPDHQMRVFHILKLGTKQSKPESKAAL